MKFKPSTGFLLDEPIKRQTPKSPFLLRLEGFQRASKSSKTKIPNKYIKDQERS
jgi:hypothetical protein